MSRIFDDTGTISVESADFPMIDPESIQKAMTGLEARPWRNPMPAAEEYGRTRSVQCTYGRGRGNYNASRYRALERDAGSSTGWGYRFFDAVPKITTACANGDTSTINRAIRDASDENRRRAGQWVALTTEIARLWNASKQTAGNALMGITPTPPREKAAGYGGLTGRAALQSPATRAKFDALRRKLSTTPQGQRWARRVEDSTLRADLSTKLRGALAAANGVSVADVDPAQVEEVVETALVDQAEVITTGGGGLSPDLQAVLDLAFPLASAERYAELFPTLPLEVQNLIAQYAQTFQALGLES